ncbi:MAG: hypothetical protein FJ267_13745, partial [Planctomycetes bacterium]|nr:hypothetical protein [Planctomycetota bacterium]
MQFLLVVALTIFTQPLGEPDRGQPGDEMIQNSLSREALRLDAQFAEDVKSKETWEANRPRYQEEYFHMLGLWPLPEKTDLRATITGTVTGDGFVVENLHYQSKPGLYVTANVYRPLKRLDAKDHQRQEGKTTSN